MKCYSTALPLLWQLLLHLATFLHALFSTVSVS
jgi:hypothetical protein